MAPSFLGQDYPYDRATGRPGDRERQPGPAGRRRHGEEEGRQRERSWPGPGGSREGQRQQKERDQMITNSLLSLY